MNSNVSANQDLGNETYCDEKCVSDEVLESAGRMSNFDLLGTVAMPTGCGCLSKPTSM